MDKDVYEPDPALEALDALVAKHVMGWEVDRDIMRAWYVDPVLGRRVRDSIPEFSRFRDHCAIAEAEIARRGLQEAYMESLAAEFGGTLNADPYGAGLMRDTYGDRWLDSEFLWRILTAPPEVRVRAMLAALSH
jgi:hypothetical protein